MMLSRLATFGVALFMSTSVGCAFSSAPGDETSSSDVAALTETFKLYGDGASAGGGRCDIHTVLTLSSREGEAEVRDPFPPRAVLYAHLHDEVTGGCKLRLDPDPRDYALLFDGEECGSLVYKASETRDGAPREMTLTDHRKRVCKDYRPASMVVEETSRSGVVRTLSTFDAARLPPTS